MMMAYGSQFVLAVLHNGSPVREIDGKVTIPFHSEYKIRLKNKNSVRAKARVWIDGRQVSGLGDFILHPGETMDLERFLDHSMKIGNRFKFVPLSDSRVNDPTDHNNGYIKVEFYKEKEQPVIKFNPWHLNIPSVPWYPNYPSDSTFGGFYNNNNDSTLKSSLGGGGTSSSISCCYNSITPVGVSPDVEGATVEGSKSNQSFVVGDNFETEFSPVTLTLKLRAPTKDRPAIIPTNPNKPRRAKHCVSCGEIRRRRSDKFCPECGNKYPIRRTC
jgi:hypothetical protein